jgi:hypothetical protein
MPGCYCCLGCGFLCQSGTVCTGSACNTGSAFAPGSAYNGSCTLSNSVVNTTGPSTYVPPDLGGGTGSFPTQLQSVLTTGLSCKVDGLLGEFGLGSFSCLLHVNANQGVTPAAAPACTAASRSAVGGGLSPGVKSLLVWGAIGAVLVYMFTRKAG